MNYSEKIKLVKSVIEAEKQKIANFLAENPEIVASDLAEDMVFIGLPVFYVSFITGVSIEEINRLKNVRH
jgi:hypothetical protein